MRAVRGAEGVVHVDVAELGEVLAELLDLGRIGFDRVTIGVLFLLFILAVLGSVGVIK